MHSERINRFFRCRKTLTSHIIFGVRKQKEVIRSQVRTIRRMTHQIGVLSAQKCSCLSPCWFSLVRRLVFLISCKTTVLVLRLRHVQFFRKNWRSFAWKCFVRRQLLLDLAYLEKPIQSTAVYFRAHKSTIHHLSPCHRRVSKHRIRIFGAFLSTNRHQSFFLSD